MPGHNPQSLWTPCFYLIAEKLGDSQSSWWHWRRGAAFCLVGWLKGRRLQLMLLHDVEVGICWLKVPLTCEVPVMAWCNFQGMARASSLSSAGVVQLPRQHVDISWARRDSSGNESCTVTFPDHGGPRNWSPDSILRESTCYFWLARQLSELRFI